MISAVTRFPDVLRILSDDGCLPIAGIFNWVRFRDVFDA